MSLNELEDGELPSSPDPAHDSNDVAAFCKPSEEAVFIEPEPERLVIRSFMVSKHNNRKKIKTEWAHINFKQTKFDRSRLGQYIDQNKNAKTDSKNSVRTNDLLKLRCSEIVSSFYGRGLQKPCLNDGRIIFSTNNDNVVVVVKQEQERLSVREELNKVLLVRRIKSLIDTILSRSGGTPENQPITNDSSVMPAFKCESKNKVEPSDAENDNQPPFLRLVDDGGIKTASALEATSDSIVSLSDKVLLDIPESPFLAKSRAFPCWNEANFSIPQLGLSRMPDTKSEISPSSHLSSADVAISKILFSPPDSQFLARRSVNSVLTPSNDDFPHLWEADGNRVAKEQQTPVISDSFYDSVGTGSLPLEGSGSLESTSVNVSLGSNRVNSCIHPSDEDDLSRQTIISAQSNVKETHDKCKYDLEEGVEVLQHLNDSIQVSRERISSCNVPSEFDIPANLPVIHMHEGSVNETSPTSGASQCIMKGDKDKPNPISEFPVGNDQPLPLFGSNFEPKWAGAIESEAITPQSFLQTTSEQHRSVLPFDLKIGNSILLEESVGTTSERALFTTPTVNLNETLKDIFSKKNAQPLIDERDENQSVLNITPVISPDATVGSSKALRVNFDQEEPFKELSPERSTISKSLSTLKIHQNERVTPAKVDDLKRNETSTIIPSEYDAVLVVSCNANKDDFVPNLENDVQKMGHVPPKKDISPKMSIIHSESIRSKIFELSDGSLDKVAAQSIFIDQKNNDRKISNKIGKKMISDRMGNEKNVIKKSASRSSFIKNLEENCRNKNGKPSQSESKKSKKSESKKTIKISSKHKNGDEKNLEKLKLEAATRRCFVKISKLRRKLCLTNPIKLNDKYEKNSSCRTSYNSKIDELRPCRIKLTRIAPKSNSECFNRSSNLLRKSRKIKKDIEVEPWMDTENTKLNKTYFTVGTLSDPHNDLLFPEVIQKPDLAVTEIADLQESDNCSISQVASVTVPEIDEPGKCPTPEFHCDSSDDDSNAWVISLSPEVALSEDEHDNASVIGADVREMTTTAIQPATPSSNKAEKSKRPTADDQCHRSAVIKVNAPCKPGKLPSHQGSNNVITVAVDSLPAFDSNKTNIEKSAKATLASCPSPKNDTAMNKSSVISGTVTTVVQDMTSPAKLSTPSGSKTMKNSKTSASKKKCRSSSVENENTACKPVKSSSTKKQSSNKSNGTAMNKSSVISRAVTTVVQDMKSPAKLSTPSGSTTIKKSNTPDSKKKCRSSSVENENTACKPVKSSTTKMPSSNKNSRETKALPVALPKASSSSNASTPSKTENSTEKASSSNYPAMKYKNATQNNKKLMSPSNKSSLKRKSSSIEEIERQSLKKSLSIITTPITKPEKAVKCLSSALELEKITKPHQLLSLYKIPKKNIQITVAPVMPTCEAEQPVPKIIPPLMDEAIKNPVLVETTSLHQINQESSTDLNEAITGCQTVDRESEVMMEPLIVGLNSSPSFLSFPPIMDRPSSSSFSWKPDRNSEIVDFCPSEQQRATLLMSHSPSKIPLPPFLQHQRSPALLDMSISPTKSAVSPRSLSDMSISPTTTTNTRQCSPFSKVSGLGSMPVDAAQPSAQAPNRLVSKVSLSSEDCQLFLPISVAATADQNSCFTSNLPAASVKLQPLSLAPLPVNSVIQPQRSIAPIQPRSQISAPVVATLPHSSTAGVRSAHSPILAPILSAAPAGLRETTTHHSNRLLSPVLAPILPLASAGLRETITYQPNQFIVTEPQSLTPLQSQPVSHHKPLTNVSETLSYETNYQQASTIPVQRPFPVQTRLLKLAQSNNEENYAGGRDDTEMPWGAPRPGYDFVSADPAENADNFDSRWARIRNVSSTTAQLYLFVRERWRNLRIPDPNRNLTHRQKPYSRPLYQQLRSWQVGPRARTQSGDDAYGNIIDRIIAGRQQEHEDMCLWHSEQMQTLLRQPPKSRFDQRDREALALGLQQAKMQQKHQIETKQYVKKLTDYHDEVRSFYQFYHFSHGVCEEPRHMDTYEETQEMFKAFSAVYDPN